MTFLINSLSNGMGILVLVRMRMCFVDLGEDGIVTFVLQENTQKRVL